MEPASQQSSRRYLFVLSPGALGVVYGTMLRNISSASTYFCRPPNQVLDHGAQAEI